MVPGYVNTRNRNSSAIKPTQLNRKSFLIFISLFIILALAPFHCVNALGGVTLTAPTRSSVSVDGVFQPNEWPDGTHLSFNWASSNNSLTGGGNVWVKTNGTDLLVAVGQTVRRSQTRDSTHTTI